MSLISPPIAGNIYAPKGFSPCVVCDRPDSCIKPSVICMDCGKMAMAAPDVTVVLNGVAYYLVAMLLDKMRGHDEDGKSLSDPNVDVIREIFQTGMIRQCEFCNSVPDHNGMCKCPTKTCKLCNMRWIINKFGINCPHCEASVKGKRIVNDGGAVFGR